MTRGTPWQIVFFSIVVVLVASPVSAFDPQPKIPGSVAIGLASGQTATIRVANDTDRFFGIVPCVCPVVSTLVDDGGVVLNATKTEVHPGGVVSDEVDLRLKSGDGRLVRGLVELTGSEGQRLACNVGTRSTLEIVETASGRTTISLPIATTYLSAEGK